MKTIKVHWDYHALASSNTDISIMERACEILNSEANELADDAHRPNSAIALDGPWSASGKEVAEAAVTRAAKELYPDANDQKLSRVAQHMWDGGGVYAMNSTTMRRVV